MLSSCLKKPSGDGAINNDGNSKLDIFGFGLFLYDLASFVQVKCQDLAAILPGFAGNNAGLMGKSAPIQYLFFVYQEFLPTCRRSDAFHHL